MTGKWHNQAESALRPHSSGQELFLGGMGDPYKLAVPDISPKRTFTESRAKRRALGQVFADTAIEFVGRRLTQAPFLAYVAFNCRTIHASPPKEYRWYNGISRRSHPISCLCIHSTTAKSRPR